MLKSNAPTKYTVPFATSGTRNAIPVASSPTPGLASYTTGFPSVTMEPIASGGVPPEGQDFNGVFYDATKASLWQQMGFVSAYDNTFATNSNVGGYAAQSLVCRSDGKGLWLSTADNNTSNPDATGATGWLAVRGNAGSTTIATTGGATTPDASVLGAPLLIISGTLTSNASIILPLSGGASWIVENNTTGSFTLTIQGSTGTGVQVAQGSPSQVYTDGTNFYATTANVSGLYLPINGNAVSASKLANARTIAMTGDVAWSVSFDGSVNVAATGTIQAASVTLAKMANFNANSLMGNPTSSSAAPQAITLANGLQFTGTTLGMGAITPSSVSATGAVSGTTGTFTGAVGGTVLTGTTSLNGPSALVNAIGPYAGSTQGFQFSWNAIAGGQGRNEYINNFGGGSGGHYFYVRSSTAGSASLVGSIDSAGALTVGAVNGAAGVFSGGITVNQNFTSSTVNFVAGPTGAGGIFLRPNGIGSATGQFTIGSTGAVTINGTITSTGTANFNTSDATLKRLTDAEPRPLHHAAWHVYQRTDTGERGRGPTAQGIAALAPDYVIEYDHAERDGGISRRLAYSKEQVALETAFWAAHQIDALLARIEALEARP